jgi:hypothetical protein
VLLGVLTALVGLGMSGAPTASASMFTYDSAAVVRVDAARLEAGPHALLSLSPSAIPVGATTARAATFTYDADLSRELMLVRWEAQMPSRHSSELNWWGLPPCLLLRLDAGLRPPPASVVATEAGRGLADNATHGPYHRQRSPTQSDDVARMQVESSEIWGRTPLQGIRADCPGERLPVTPAVAPTPGFEC